MHPVDGEDDVARQDARLWAGNPVTTLPMPTRPVSTRLPLTAYTANISEIAMSMCMIDPAVITSMRRG